MRFAWQGPMIGHFVIQFCGQRLFKFSATIIQFFGHDLDPSWGFFLCLWRSPASIGVYILGCRTSVRPRLHILTCGPPYRSTQTHDTSSKLCQKSPTKIVNQDSSESDQTRKSFWLTLALCNFYWYLWHFEAII